MVVLGGVLLGDVEGGAVVGPLPDVLLGIVVGVPLGGSDAIVDGFPAVGILGHSCQIVVWSRGWGTLTLGKDAIRFVEEQVCAICVQLWIPHGEIGEKDVVVGCNARARVIGLDSIPIITVCRRPCGDVCRHWSERRRERR